MTGSLLYAAEQRGVRTHADIDETEDALRRDNAELKKKLRRAKKKEEDESKKKKRETRVLWCMISIAAVILAIALTWVPAFSIKHARLSLWQKRPWSAPPSDKTQAKIIILSCGHRSHEKRPKMNSGFTDGTKNAGITNFSFPS